ncbi:hypothetical protein [Lentibacillus salinarum]|uniref:Uncharacterized protein n=1 Tax=Lentibacillus salinarum TaxID=446820 RepID=A0ABW3ZXT9_9BACI
MEKKLPGHLVGFGSVQDLQRLEEDYYGEFTDAGMTARKYRVYEDVPSKEECDLICKELSGEAKIYKMK